MFIVLVYYFKSCEFWWFLVRIDQATLTFCNGTSPVTVGMSRWNTRQKSSAKFCQLDRILPNSADLIDFCQILPKRTFQYNRRSTEFCRILLTWSTSAKFCQALPESTEVCRRLRAYVRTHRHQEPRLFNYKILALFLSFLYATSYPYKSYTIRFR
jgi:hypothetical protein